MLIKKYKIVTCSLLLLLGLTSCKKYLNYETPVDGTITKEQVFSSREHSRNFLNNVYEGLGGGRFPVAGELGLSTASDEAVSNNLGAPTNIFNTGAWGPTRLYDDQYIEQYRNIRRANLFLENAPISAIKDAADLGDLMGQAYFLRAMFHFELMKRYGGVILATKSYTATENLNSKKNSFEETYQQIVKDCDSAALKLKAATTTL